MAVEVVTPEDFLGDIIGDLNSRRGPIACRLLSLPSFIFHLAWASYSMEPSHYEEVPRNVAEEIIQSGGAVTR